MNQESSDSRNPNVCFSCASLFDDIQDNMILESAIPMEWDKPEDALQEDDFVQEEDPGLEPALGCIWGRAHVAMIAGPRQAWPSVAGLKRSAAPKFLTCGPFAVL